VLGKALERFPTEVETVEIGIWRLQTGCDPERVRIVIEAAAIGQCGAQRPLAGMAERRMAEVVRQAQGLGQVLVEPERARQGSSNRRNLQAVRYPNAKVVAIRSDEHLSLVAKAPERDGMDDSIPVALEDVTRTART